MALNIRLSEIGKKHNKSYRIVVSPIRARRNGNPIETLGFYNPKEKTTKVKINEERLKYWIGVGAKQTERMTKILNKLHQK